MIRFAVVGHLASTDPGFSLNDMPGGAGRMDILCRCVNTSLFLSHGLRRDVECYLVLNGGPSGPKTVLFSGEQVRYLSPDERSAGALIKKALGVPAGLAFRESTPGVFVRKGGLLELVKEHRFAILDERGNDIRSAPVPDDSFLLSDHMDLTADEQALLEGAPRYSVGPVTIHADHAITVLLNQRDREAAGL
ncbi:MAG: tRNA (pseudouridine(54)-N(1))-methyltransferase TrmY [Methanoregulaceae archaeon]|nr:tRNA (pseudouridine(54)-N(1))-methyltransferase TrmY [Methanoregulaceae archaeon]